MEVRGATLASRMPSTSQPGQLLADERMVLDLLLAGDHPVLETLRAQAAGVWVSFRNDGGRLRHAWFEVPAELPRCEIAVAELGDVLLEFDGGEARGRARLLVQDGELSTRELTAQLAEARAELEKERKLRRAFRNQLLESRDAEEAGDHSMEPPRGFRTAWWW